MLDNVSFFTFQGLRCLNISHKALLLRKGGRYNLVKTLLQFFATFVWSGWAMSHPTNFMSLYLSFMTPRIYAWLVITFLRVWSPEVLMKWACKIKIAIKCSLYEETREIDFFIVMRLHNGDVTRQAEKPDIEIKYREVNVLRRGSWMDACTFKLKFDSPGSLPNSHYVLNCEWNCNFCYIPRKPYDNHDLSWVL